MKNSATGVTRLMAKFKIGQIVRCTLDAALDYSFSPDTLFKIVSVAKGFNYRLIGISGIWNLKPVKNVRFGLCEYEIELAYPTCPVCNAEVVIENNRIKEHHHNNELCYGSYIPYA